MPHKMQDDIQAAYDRFDPPARKALLKTRDLVFDVAGASDTIGNLTETLKWGEPSYLTEQTKSGSTLRLSTRRGDGSATLFVNCKTNLIERFKQHYPTTFDYDGNRALVIDLAAEKQDALKHCIELVLNYHRLPR